MVSQQENHDVATLKEALRIARAAVKDIQKDLGRRNRRVYNV